MVCRIVREKHGRHVVQAIFPENELKHLQWGKNATIA
jgi:hypothetical protein